MMVKRMKGVVFVSVFSVKLMVGINLVKLSIVIVVSMIVIVS